MGSLFSGPPAPAPPPVIPTPAQAQAAQTAQSNGAYTAQAAAAAGAIGTDKLANPNLGTLGVPQQSTGVASNSLF